MLGARATVTALMPLVAEAVALHRQALADLVASLPDDPDGLDSGLGAAYERFTAESGARGLRVALQCLADLVADAAEPATPDRPVTTLGGVSP